MVQMWSIEERDGMLPPGPLYRGDADPGRLRGVVASWHHGFMQTNLGAGGNGAAIYSAPIGTLVANHVSPGWPLTHFLSFTTSRARAEAFATGTSQKTLTPLPINAPTWDTSIFTLDVSRLTHMRSLQVGVELCSYPALPPPPGLPLMLAIARQQVWKAQAGAPITILLIDVVTALSALVPATAEVQQAIANAMRDGEWLVLPSTPFVQLGTPPGLTCLLDDSCISFKEKFALV